MRVPILFAAVLGIATSASAQEPDFANLDLVGNRFSPLTYEAMTPAQKTMTENIFAGPRTAMGGPFNALLRSPEMGDLAQALGAYIRFGSSLPATLRELAIIMTARHWTAHFEWYAHKNAALAAGLDPAIVDAVAAGRRPEFLQTDEQVVYEFCNELFANHRVSDATFEAAIAAFGERGVIDLVGTVGYYSFVSMVLNVDEYPLPEGVEPELGPLP